MVLSNVSWTQTSMGHQLPLLRNTFQCLINLMIKKYFLTSSLKFSWCRFEPFSCILSLVMRQQGPSQEVAENGKVTSEHPSYKIDDTSALILSSQHMPFIPFTSYLLGFDSVFLMVFLSHTNPNVKYSSTWYYLSVTSSANYFVTILVDSQSCFSALTTSFQLFSIFFCLFLPFTLELSKSRTKTNTKQNETLTLVETSRIVIQIAKSCENSRTH